MRSPCLNDEQLPRWPLVGHIENLNHFGTQLRKEDYLGGNVNAVRSGVTLPAFRINLRDPLTDF